MCVFIYIILHARNEVNENIRSIKFEKQTTARKLREHSWHDDMAWHAVAVAAIALMQLSKSRCELHY